MELRIWAAVDAGGGCGSEVRDRGAAWVLCSEGRGWIGFGQSQPIAPAQPSQLVCKQSRSRMLGPDRQALATKAWTAPCACRQPAQRASPLCHTPTTHDVARLANVLPLSGCQCTAAPATLAVLTALAALPAWAVGTHSAPLHSCTRSMLAHREHCTISLRHRRAPVQPVHSSQTLFASICPFCMAPCQASRLASHLTNPYSH
jgi:hypothetical protein